MSPPVALQCSRLDNKIIGQRTGRGKFQMCLAKLLRCPLFDKVADVDLLNKILASPAFANAERMRRYLRSVVEYALSSPNESLKEMTVGMALYAGNGDFDPRTTAVVRVDATRLRAKLLEYYSSHGAGDPIVIDLPKGSYSPIFAKPPIIMQP